MSELLSNTLGFKNKYRGSCLFFFLCVGSYIYQQITNIDIYQYAFSAAEFTWSWHGIFVYLMAHVSHLDFYHLFGNMFLFVLLAPSVEQDLKFTKFMWLVLVSSIGASAGQTLINGVDSGGIGASGVIFGLMGAFLVPRKFSLFWLLTLLVVGTRISIEVLQLPGFDGIGHAAHVGGFFGGLTTKCLFEIRRLRKCLTAN